MVLLLRSLFVPIPRRCHLLSSFKTPIAEKCVKLRSQGVEWQSLSEYGAPIVRDPDGINSVFTSLINALIRSKGLIKALIFFIRLLFLRQEKKLEERSQTFAVSFEPDKPIKLKPQYTMTTPSTPPQSTLPFLPSPSAPPPDRSIEEVEASPALACRREKQVLTAKEIKQDPILSALAKTQKGQWDPVPPSPVAFKAKPAPKLINKEGPRMNKTEALRQGLKWEKRPSTAGPTLQSVPFGSKRESLVG